MRRGPEPPTFAARLGLLLTWIVLLGFGGFAIALAAMVLGFGDGYEPGAWTQSVSASESVICTRFEASDVGAAAALPFLTIAIFLWVFASSAPRRSHRPVAAAMRSNAVR